MKKRICIIPSGVLNPDNTIESDFELTQSVILSKLYEVTIFTVNCPPALYVLIKMLIKKFLNIGEKNKLNFKNLIKQLIKSLFFYIFKRYRIKKYIIRNIKVVEIINYSLLHQKSFDKNINRWVLSGIKGFKKYFIDNGIIPDLVMSHGRFLKAGVLAYEIKRRFGIDYTYTEYVTLYREGKVTDESKKYLELILNNSKMNIFISEGIKKDVEDFLKKTVNHYKIIPLPMDLMFDEKSLNINKKSTNSFVFTNIGYLTERKRQKLLINAFFKAFNGDNNFILNIVGSGELYSELNNLVNALKLNNVVNIMGYKNSKEILNILDNSDVFVFPSKDETLGVAVIEAISRGLPVIATICGGPEYILNDKLGILIPTDNEEALINAMKKIYKDYFNYDKFYIRNFALNNYGSKVFIEKIQNLLK